MESRGRRSAADPARGRGGQVILSDRWIQDGGPDFYDVAQIGGDALEGTFEYRDGGRGILSGEEKPEGRVKLQLNGILNSDPNRRFTADVWLTAGEARTTLIGSIIYNNDGNPMKITLRLLDSPSRSKKN